MDTDSFVCPVKAANLYIDGALSPANMAEVVLAVEKLSEGGL